MPHLARASEKIKTPIGSLSFSAMTEEGDLDNCKITICRLDPEIPKGMSVDSCISALLRCSSSKPLKGFVFSCEWDNLQTVGYGNSGEALDAWEWESDDILVMIGTEDSEWLNSRLRLDKEYSPEYYPVTMHDNKITIEIESFKEDKELSLHFVIAWNSLPEPVDCSCWYAVDVPHERILQAFCPKSVHQKINELDVTPKCNYNNWMEFEWDNTKRKLNIKKHGIDFVDAPTVFDGYTLTIIDDRIDYGEERFVTFGILDGRVVVVVHTENDGSIRIISIRRATKYEEKAYFSQLPDRLGSC